MKKRNQTFAFGEKKMMSNGSGGTTAQRGFKVSPHRGLGFRV
jgi:hypothetical protein